MQDIAKTRYEKALRLARSKSQNLEKISKLLAESAELGSGEAAYALATWYLHGNYFKTNLQKGTRLLRSAAKSGVPLACFDLAVSYEKGIILDQNFEKAFQLYMEASLRGDIAARKEVARCLWHGIGTPKNRTLANLWADFAPAAKPKASKLPL